MILKNNNKTESVSVLDEDLTEPRPTSIEDIRGRKGIRIVEEGC